MATTTSSNPYQFDQRKADFRNKMAELLRKRKDPEYVKYAFEQMGADPQVVDEELSRLTGRQNVQPQIQAQGEITVGGRTFTPETYAQAKDIKQQQQQEVAQKEAMRTKVSSIDEALKDEKGLKSAVGTSVFGRGVNLPYNIYSDPNRQRFLGTVGQFLNTETLNQLISAKAGGATFGALSEGELTLLRDSASKLNVWSIKDKDGRIIGFNVDENTFKKELNTVKDLTQKALQESDKIQGDQKQIKVAPIDVNLKTPEEAAQFIKDYPDDPRSSQVKQKLDSIGYQYDKGQVLGERQQQPEQKNGFINDVSSSFMNRTGNISDILNTNQSNVSKVAQVTGQELGLFSDIAGSAIGNVLSAITPDFIEKPVTEKVQSLVKAGINTDAAKSVVSAWDNFKKENPEIAGNIEAAGNVAEFFSLALGGGAARKGVGTIGKTVGKAIPSTLEEATTTLTKLGEQRAAKMSTKAVNNFKTRLVEQIEGKKASKVALDQSRTDIIDTIAKNPDYHPIVDPTNKTLNTTKAVENINRDISSYSESIGNLFQNLDNVDGGITTSDIASSIQKNLLNKKNQSKFVVSGDAPFKEIQSTLERMQQVYGDKVPRKDLWEIRKYVDDTINTISDTNIKKSLRQDVRKAFKSSLEDSVTGDSQNLVKRSMDEVGKLIEAKDYLNKELNTFKISGGKLSDLIRNATVSTVGKTIGAGVGATAGGAGTFGVGAAAGAVAGYAISEKIGKWLAKNTLSTGKERKALQNLIKSKPSVFDEIKSYIEKLPKNESKNAMREFMKIEQK